MKKILLVPLTILSPTVLHFAEAIGMYLLWNKINPFLWWIIFIILIIFYFGIKTYNTALTNGSDPNVIQFWYIARSIIFILDILIIISMITYLIFSN